MSLRVGPLNKNHSLPVAKETRQVGSELAKVNGLTAKAEVSLHELSSSTDIEKVGFGGGLSGWGARLGLKGMKGVLVEDMVFWVIFGGIVTSAWGVDCWSCKCDFWNRRSEEKACLVCIAHTHLYYVYILSTHIRVWPGFLDTSSVLFADWANSGTVSGIWFVDPMNYMMVRSNVYIDKYPYRLIQMQIWYTVVVNNDSRYPKMRFVSWISCSIKSLVFDSLPARRCRTSTTCQRLQVPKTSWDLAWARIKKGLVPDTWHGDWLLKYAVS